MIERLLERARAAGVPLTQEQVEKIEVYHRMLTEANARFNLTRVPDDPAEAVDRNYLDCLMPLRREMPRIERAIDVGSGAGFPGVPLAICLPGTRFTLLDSLGKRVEFLKQVIAELGLNAEAMHLRAEDAARKPELREQFDLATARAVAPLNLLAEYLLPFVRTGGRMLAYKGPTAEDELKQARNALEILGGEYLRTELAPIPGRDWEHRLVWIEKTGPTPEKYPRKAGKPEKAPL